jgi:hypothetical protein
VTASPEDASVREVLRPWRAIVASALDWQEAHARFDSAVGDVPPALRGIRPDRFPHSVWELLEHIRLAQTDLVDFMENPAYVAPAWPDGYWPDTPAPPSAHAWDAGIATVRRDLARLESIALREELDLTARIPWGDGQTYLRTILVALDHTSYHVGQIVAVRQLLGAWPAG